MMGDTPSYFTKLENDIITNISKIGPYAFCVYSILKMMQGKNGKCWPSLRYLQNMTGFSRPTVISALKKLKETEIITIEHKNFKSNSYSVSGKLRLLVNDVYQGGKCSLPGVVNDIDQGGKPRLPEVVNDVYPNKIYMNNTQEKDKIEKDSFNNNFFSLLSQPYQILSKFSDWQPEITIALQKKEKFILNYLQTIDKIIKFDSITTEIIFRAKASIDANPFYKDKPHLRTVEWFFKFDKNGQGAAAHIRKLANNHQAPTRSRYKKI